MSQYFHVHPHNPQQRLMRQAADIIRQGGVVAYPTDTCYALGCHLGDKAAVERIAAIRKLDDKHLYTLLCADLSSIATYARVDNACYRLLKAHTPGAFTFVLEATSDVPRRLLNSKRRTIGIRVPDHVICHALLAELSEPLLSTSLVLPGAELPLDDPEDIRAALEKRVDLIIDGGMGEMMETTVIDLTSSPWSILRQGKGDMPELA